MGGNATKQFNTVRINKKEYDEYCKTILNELCYYNNKYKAFNNEYLNKNNNLNYSIVIPESFKSKSSFGDVDCLSSILIDEFDKIVNKSECIKVIGKSSNKFSYALQVKIDGKWGKPFQFDYIYTPENNLIYKNKYLNYNDLSNFIGTVANNMGFTFSEKGLYKKIYFDKDGNTSNKRISKSINVSKILLTDNFEEAISFLGFDVNRYNKGFNDITDILDYIASSKYFQPKYFQPKFFDINETTENGKSKRRNAKRPLYVHAVEYYKNNIDTESINNKQLNICDIYEKFPNFPNDLALERKRVKSKINFNNRVSFGKIEKILGKLDIIIDDNIKKIKQEHNKIFISKKDYKNIITNIKKIDNIFEDSLKLNKKDFNNKIELHLKQNINDILDLPINKKQLGNKIKM